MVEGVEVEKRRGLIRFPRRVSIPTARLDSHGASRFPRRGGVERQSHFPQVFAAPSQ